MTPKTRILEQLADEAQHVARAAVMDLDAFLALSGDERAARWRQFDGSAKFQLVALMLVRKYGDWTCDEIEHWVSHYDEKYALPPVTAAVEGALERLAVEHADYARAARTAGEKADAKQWQRAANAYAKALAAWSAGIRPEPTVGGGYILPSQRPGQPAHLLTKDGDWVCSCASGQHIHWASALIVGIEVAHDALESGTAGEAVAEEPEPEEPSGQPPIVPSWSCRPDDPCDLHDPCPAHADLAAAYLAEEGNRALAELAAEQEDTYGVEPSPVDLGRRLALMRRAKLAA